MCPLAIANCGLRGVALVAAAVPCMDNAFGTDLDDGPVVGFVLVVTANLGFGLGRMCVPARLKSATNRREGPGGLVLGDHGR